MKVKLLVDSTCDLPLDYLKKNDVGIIPLIVGFDEEQYQDLIELSTKELYQKVKEKNKLPRTSARSIGEFDHFFKKYLSEGYDQVLYIGLSSHFSSTLQNAVIASQEFEGKVFVHDTLNLSTGEGLQVIKAVEFKNNGLDASQILERLKEITPKVRSQFAVETLEYLHKGGRCSQTTYFFGKTLRIKPIIRVIDGKMVVYKKPIGKMTNALNKLLDIFKADLDNMDVSTVMITHSLADESASYLHQELRKYIPEENIMITNAGCVISSHCGKGTIGILYILK